MDEVLIEAIRRVGAVALALPETREEDAWAGVRWRIRNHTFAQVAPIRDGRPEGWSRALGERGPLDVLVVRASPADQVTFEHLGRPWFTAGAPPRAVGLVLGADTDWDEVAEVVIDSYCLKAPKMLVAQLARP